jgi:hypothetical protein
MEKIDRNARQEFSNNLSNLEKIKNLKRRADELSAEYHENIERLKFYDKDIEFMIKKIATMDSKLEKLVVNYK